MRKPISKNALRRALEQVREEGHVQYTHPVGTVVDKLWHELGKEVYHSPRKKPTTRETVRTNDLLERAEAGIAGNPEA